MFRNNKKIRGISIFSTLFLLISLCFSLYAQDNQRSEKVVIGGKMYTIYTVASGETPFSIAKKFEISLDELIHSNPEIKDKLKSGQTVKIPVRISEAKSADTGGLQNDESEDRSFIYHSVRKKETVFSIAQKRNVTSEDIYHFNPRARDGIREGEVLKIPKPKTSESETRAAAILTMQPVKHIVSRKETLFSIARKYNTTPDEILKSNPTVKGTLRKGTILIIPRKPVLPEIQEKPKAEPKFLEYLIVSGDNYFQLEKRFGVSKSELEQLNPTLKDGFKTGMTIQIPVKISTEVQGIKNTVDQSSDQKQQIDTSRIFSSKVLPGDLNKTFQIGIFLPFCQNLNDSTKIVQRTASFLEFYSGVLLATGKITEAGMKVKLYTYDTYQDSKVVERLVKKPEFLSLDLIIGPVYPDNQKAIAELSAKNRIPMISPLSSDSRFVSTTPGYYQINPGRKLRVSGTADYISNKFAGQNIIVLSHGTNSGDVQLIIDRLNQDPGRGKFRQYNILAGGARGLEGMLVTDKENVIVLADGNEANVSVAITRLNTISKANKITVIGLQEYTRMQSIDIEYLHNTRLHYLAPYFVDFGNPKVNAFIEKYRASYSSDPTQYSFQGYDIALHFLASLAMSGKNFPAANVPPGVDLLQADYSFQKPFEFGGYMNQTFFIVEYTDNYEVRSAGKIRGTMVKGISEGNEKGGLEQ